MTSIELGGFFFLLCGLVLNLALTMVMMRKLNRMPAPLPMDMAPDMEVGLKPGTPAPDFQAETPAGEVVRLAQFANQTVSLIFLSHQCPPCVQKLAALQAFAARAQQLGTQLVLVFGDPDREKVRLLIENYKLTLPVLLAPVGEYSLVIDYQANVTPSYCTINRHGVVAATGVLGHNWEQELPRQWKEVQKTSLQLQPSVG